MDTASHHHKALLPSQFVFPARSPTDPEKRLFSSCLYLEPQRLLVFGQYCSAEQTRPVAVVTFKYPDLTLQGRPGRARSDQTTCQFQQSLTLVLGGLGGPRFNPQPRASPRTTSWSGAFRRWTSAGTRSWCLRGTATGSTSGVRATLAHAAPSVFMDFPVFLRLFGKLGEPNSNGLL